MNNLIGFFSSDARSLYIEDIYRTLALSNKSIIHFRYGQKYIEDDIVTNFESYIGNKGIIFFVTGNDLRTPEDARNKKYHSIRHIIIKDILKSEHTGLIHFYLELGEFCDCEISKFSNDKFVTHISVTEGINHKWIDRVKTVKDYFEDILFFNYEILSKNNTSIFPVYSNLSKDAIYELEDETEYILKCSFYDKLEGESSLSITDSEILTIHYKESSKIAATIDDRSYKLLTHTTSQSSTPVRIVLSPNSKQNTNNDKQYEVVSFFEIKKRKLSTIIFGVVTSLAFSSILLSKVFGIYVKDSGPPWLTFLTGFIALLLFGVSGAVLYKFFNKK